MLVAVQDLIAPKRHIFLSPHYDDIALSAGGVAALLSANGRTPEVALIFGDHPDPNVPLTAFAQGMHKDWGMDADQVIAGRRAEEAVASLTLGACDRYLPFRDAIYREDRYTSDEQLFGDKPHPGDANIPGEIVTALNLTPADKANTRIYAPLAVGRHVDHQLAFAAGKQLLDAGWAVWYYEDLPYSLLPANVNRRLPEVEALGLAPAATVGVGSVWTRKIDAIMAYPSQLSTIFGQYVGVGSTREAIDAEMARYAEVQGDGNRAERFWSAHA